MDRFWRLLSRQPSYQPLDGGSVSPERANRQNEGKNPAFSWTAYLVFLLVGVAMLWAWNMFMAAAPYFQQRFRTSQPILSNFQATELSVSSIANLGSVLVLAKLQVNASYPRRIVVSLVISLVTFTLLAISTRAFLSVSAAGYFSFMIVMVAATSLATGFMQNGALAYASGFKSSSVYIQALMVGQAIAGVSPPIVQIVSVLSAKEESGQPVEGASNSAFSYFLTATGVSVVTLLAFLYLLSSHRETRATKIVTASAQDETTDSGSSASQGSESTEHAQSVPLTYLARRLLVIGGACFLTFAVTMVFPVFSQEIVTTNPNPSPLLRDAAFIPLALLVWNTGDLMGRIIPLSSKLSLAHRPRLLLILSIARVLFVPLYLICNISPPEESPSEQRLGVGPMPDAFYLFIVQLPFGLTSGYIGSCCMMGANACVEEHEHEAAGGFMGLVLVGGLAVGSFCSFFIGNS